MMHLTRSSLASTVGAIAVALSLSFSLSAAAAPQMLPQADGSSYADQIADKEEEKAALEAEQQAVEDLLSETQAEIVAANRRRAEVIEQQKVVEREIAIAESQLQSALVNQRRVEERLAAAEAQDEAISKRIAEDTARLEELREIVAELARQSYRSAGQDSSLRLVLGAADTDDFISEFTRQHAVYRTEGNALAEMEQLAAQDRNLAARQQAVRDYIGELKVLADHYVAEAEASRKIAEDKKAELQDLYDEVLALEKFLHEKADEYEAEQDRLEDEYLQLRIDIIKLQRAQAPGIYGDGLWNFPTAVPYITSPYGYRIHPIYKTRRLHGGTDFRARCGTEILAAADGRVEWTQYKTSYGNQVMLTHGRDDNGVNWNSSYNHLSAFNVSPGDYVVRGQVIAFAGTTGTSTACHLHFEVYKNGDRIDPMTVLPKL